MASNLTVPPSSLNRINWRDERHQENGYNRDAQCCKRKYMPYYITILFLTLILISIFPEPKIGLILLILFVILLLLIFWIKNPIPVLRDGFRKISCCKAGDPPLPPPVHV
ncbi:uncharacterized protein LOC129976651 [Argiope bruennichi]|nr:uncharacterized protein LOC129976651 [Argiope bruennichi]